MGERHPRRDLRDETDESEPRDLDANNSDSNDDDAASTTAPHWYAIPVWRLVVLSLLGGWFYQTHWMYRSWQAYRASWGYSRAPEWRVVYERTGFRVSPFWRAILGVYCYGLLVAMRREARVLGLKSWIAPWPMFAAWCACSMLGPWLDAWWFRVSSALLFVPAQLTVNRLGERVTGSKLREPPSHGEVVAALAGLIALSLSLLVAGVGR
jgi:hypothetical protein